MTEELNSETYKGIDSREAVLFLSSQTYKNTHQEARSTRKTDKKHTYHFPLLNS